MKNVIHRLEWDLRSNEVYLQEASDTVDQLRQRWEGYTQEIAKYTETIAEIKRAIEVLKGADAIQE